MTVTQIYGLNDYDHAKLEVTLSREDVEKLKAAVTPLKTHGYFQLKETIHKHTIIPLLDAIITEAEK